MMKRSTLDLWVGVFVAIGFGALLFLSLKVANLTSLDTSDVYKVKARFDNIGGLKVRARSRVPACGGRISDIQFMTDTYEAEVVMSIDTRYPFPRDTSAKILTSGLLGDQYVGLQAGGDTVNLKTGETLKLTQSAIVLESLIGQFLYSKAAEGTEKAEKK